MSELDDFNKCVNHIKKNGIHYFKCKLGLFEISSRFAANAHTEALHYFKQYKSGGEYSSIIGGASVMDIL